MRIFRKFNNIDEIIKYFSYRQCRCIIFFVFDKKHEEEILIKTKKDFPKKSFLIHHQNDEMYLVVKSSEYWESAIKTSIFKSIYENCEEYIKRIEYKNKKIGANK